MSKEQNEQEEKMSAAFQAACLSLFTQTMIFNPGPRDLIALTILHAAFANPGNRADIPTMVRTSFQVADAFLYYRKKPSGLVPPEEIDNSPQEEPLTQ